MAMPKDILKRWFETGDRPTGPQFAMLIDSLRHVDDLIKITDLHPDLRAALQASALSGNTIIINCPGNYVLDLSARTTIREVEVDGTGGGDCTITRQSTGDVIASVQYDASDIALMPVNRVLKAGESLLFETTTPTLIVVRTI